MSDAAACGAGLVLAELLVTEELFIEAAGFDDVVPVAAVLIDVVLIDVVLVDVVLADAAFEDVPASAAEGAIEILTLFGLIPNF